MRNALKMVVCSALLMAAMFSFSAFTSAPSAHAAPAGMNPHTTPAGATAHVTGPQSAAVSCYDQGYQLGSYVIASDLTDFQIRHTYVASPYCNDINIKITQQAGPTQARVLFLDKTTGAVKSVGSWKTISSTNTWYVLASGVLDTTNFTYEFNVPYPGTTFTIYQAY